MDGELGPLRTPFVRVLRNRMMSFNFFKLKSIFKQLIDFFGTKQYPKVQKVTEH